MKLLRDFPRLCIAGLRAACGRRAPVACAFNVTVPPPLARPVNDDSAVVIELPRATVAGALTRRREPASYLKVVRHRRVGCGR